MIREYLEYAKVRLALVRGELPHVASARYTGNDACLCDIDAKLDRMNATGQGAFLQLLLTLRADIKPEQLLQVCNCCALKFYDLSLPVNRTLRIESEASQRLALDRRYADAWNSGDYAAGDRLMEEWCAEVRRLLAA